MRDGTERLNSSTYLPTYPAHELYSTLFPAIDISIVLAPLSSTKVYGIPLLISLARAATFPFGSMATTLALGQTIEKQHKWDAIPCILLYLAITTHS